MSYVAYTSSRRLSIPGIEASIQGTIPDGNCYYHALALALAPSYRLCTLPIEKRRLFHQDYIDGFRRGLVRWLISPSHHSVDEAHLYITRQPWYLHHLLETKARDPHTIAFKRLTPEVCRRILNDISTGITPDLTDIIDRKTGRPLKIGWERKITYHDEPSRRRSIAWLYENLGRAERYYEQYPYSLRESVAKDYTKLVPLLRSSINQSTGRLFSSSEIEALLKMDPRSELIKDEEVRKLPLNLNYFIMNSGLNILRSEHSSAEDGKKTWSLPVLLETINPVIRNGVVDRSRTRDAGDDDIIPLMPHILDINIVIAISDGKSGLRKYIANGPGPEGSVDTTKSYVVLHSISGHFELITASGTVFNHDHPLIRYLFREG